MAIVTLCPQCQTGFSVQPEHLSAADGWVKCGKCEHLFQVDQHLFEMDDPQPVQEFLQPLSRPLQADAKHETGQHQDTTVVLMLLALLACYHNSIRVRSYLLRAALVPPSLSPWRKLYDKYT